MDLSRPLLGCLLLTAGCTGFVQPSELRPPAHPLLASISASSAPTPSRAAPTAQRAPSRHKVARRAARAVGKPGTDQTLLRAAFGEHPLAELSDPDGAWAATDPREGSPRKGDLLVFLDDDQGPWIAVVLRHERGAYTAAAALRGKVREIRLEPDRPTLRRRGGHVVNSFLRPRRKADAAGTRYLAGARLLGVRRYGP